MFGAIVLAIAELASAGDPSPHAPAPSVPIEPRTQLSARPRQVPLPSAVPAPSGASAPGSPAPVPSTGAAALDPAAPSPDGPKFTSEAKWELAGYNNDEVVYTVFVTSQDTRIIRCTTEVKGFYFENGTKLSISDRQITTVFPNQPTRVGYWMDMDQQSGATYSVKCHTV
jgi:hypothetical protein